MSTETKKPSTEKKTTTAVAKKDFDVTAYVMKKVDAFEKAGQLKLPKNYSAQNAIRGAQLILADMKKDRTPVVDYCTRSSVANALFKMITLGLSVVKKQGNFIVYGKELQFQEEYTGNIVLAKRYGGLAENPKTHVIYKGEDFDYEIDTETGITKILKHKPTLESLGNRSEIRGAYCIYKTTDGVVDVEIMNIEQIENAWKQGAMKGNSPAHKNFPDQMSKKTVINRTCKLLIRGSDDSALYNAEEDNGDDRAKQVVNRQVKDNANQEIIDIETIEVKEEEEEGGEKNPSSNKNEEEIPQSKEKPLPTNGDISNKEKPQPGTQAKAF